MKLPNITYSKYCELAKIKNRHKKVYQMKSSKKVRPVHNRQRFSPATSEQRSQAYSELHRSATLHPRGGCGNAT